MLTYNFANIGSDSLYEYLYKCIKNDILLGNIRPGEKLPSKRTFAKNLGISVITVENAYAQLVAEGYLYSMPKRGFYAADLEIEDSMRDAVPKEILQVANGETSYFADFSSNQTDSEIFPFTIWTRTVRAVLNDNRIQLMINSPCAGILKLRSAIAKYLREFRGMQVLPEQIIVGAGTEYLHNLLIQLLGNDLVYGVEDPGYHKIARIYESMKVRYEPVPLDQDGVSVQELEKRSVDIIHTSPSHHFPTGTVMPVSRRMELVHYAAQKGSLIIEDDFENEFVNFQRPTPSLFNLAGGHGVVYIGSFSRLLLPSIRLSFMVLPPDLSRKYAAVADRYSQTASKAEQIALCQFIRDGHLTSQTKKLKKLYAQKLKKLKNEVRNTFGSDCTIQTGAAGTSLALTVPCARTGLEIKKEARMKGFNLLILEESADTITLLLSCSSIPADDFAPACRLLKELLNK
jgi:GntR family transcriptional regulator/MocR family aminotransferase